MITTTLRKMKDTGFSSDRYKLLIGKLRDNGWDDIDAELPLKEMRPIIGEEDTVWALELSNRPEIIPLIAAGFAKTVLSV